jgi:uncharacterized repeat protein (TIGR02543 family)
LAQSLRLNEVMPSNFLFLADETGDYPDWIELYNSGSSSVNTGGFYLSDTRKNLTKWRLPYLDLARDSFLTVFASEKNLTNAAQQWSTVIRKGDIWNYLVPTSEPNASWRLPGFSNAGWSSGPSGFGLGDNDDATVVPLCISVYIRKSFYISDTSVISGGYLHLDFDDGFVAYLNGHEIARFNTGTTGTYRAWNQPATAGHEAKMYSGGLPDTYRIDSVFNYLRNGENVLAIQVHNQSATSGDLTCIPFLSLLSPENPAEPVPAYLKLPVGVYHTNFKVDADGDTIYLSNAQGFIIDSLRIDPCRPDLSLGRQPDGTGKWYTFQDPTPSKPNTTKTYTAVWEAPVKFTPPAGFYNENLLVSLSSISSSDSIYYTTDGSEPGFTSMLYKNPINIAGSSVLRARVLKKGYLPGTVHTHSYIQGRTGNLPVVSFSTTPANLFDYYTGIYVLGPNASDVSPFKGANFWMDWERPAHVEMFEPDGKLAFGLDAGIKIFGNYSRAQAQKSLAFYARKAYGTKEINYKVFPDLNIDRFGAMIVRNSGNDFFGANRVGASMMRDMLHTSMARPWGLEAAAGRQVAVYINGEYWGVQNLREKVNENFLSAHSGVAPENMNILERNSIVVQGNSTEYKNLVSFASLNDLANPQNYAYMGQKMDIDNFIHYYLLQLYIGNTDWPQNNIKFWKPADGTGLWRWILFDTDFGFGRFNTNLADQNSLLRLLDPSVPKPPATWSTLLFRRLLANQEFRHKFINDFADHINTSFHTDTVKLFINKLYEGIKDEMPAHCARWGGTMQEWNTAINTLNRFAEIRPDTFRYFISSTLSVPGPYQLNLSIPAEGTGSIRVNSIQVKQKAWTGYYFGTVPISLTPIPAPGYKFTGWTGTVTSSETVFEVTMSGTVNLTAHFSADPAADPSPVIINEICFNPSPGKNCYDWIELYNRSNNYIDLGGYVLRNSETLKPFTLPGNTILAPNSYLVLCRNSREFSVIYPLTKNYSGNFAFDLKPGSDSVKLTDPDGNTADIVCYNTVLPWPETTNGTGFTLALVSPERDNDQALNWQASVHLYGTPGYNNGTNSRNESSLNGSETIQLSQNYPNPFGHTTHFLIFTSQPETISLKVYDLNGRLVGIIAEKSLNEGYMEYSWTPQGAGSGVYIVKLETRNSVRTQRILFANYE